MSVDETAGGSTPPAVADASDEPSAEDLLVGPDADVDPAVSVVLPTLNEEDGVRTAIERAKSAIEHLGVSAEVVVSDSSTDRTPEIAAEMGAIVVEPDEPGYGYAYRYAFERVRGEYVVIGDADTTYDFEEFPRLFRRVAYGDADIALGSRFAGEIKDGAMPPLHEHVGNPLLTRFLNAFYGADVTDAHSGFRVIDRAALERMDLQSDGMEFASEMLMEAAARDLTIVEEPITYHERAGEATLDSFRDGWRHVRFMLVNAPTYLFTLPAVAFTAVGALVMALSLVGASVSGISFGVHTIIAGSLMTIVGFQAGGLAVFSAVAADPILAPGDPIIDWLTDHFRLEHGVTLGAGLVLVGGGYVAAVLAQYFASGFTRIPFVEWHMVAFTAIVLGVQLGLQSFFFSLIGSNG